MYKDSKIELRCVVEVTDGFEMGVQLYQRSALPPLVCNGDRQVDKWGQAGESMDMMFADDIVICSIVGSK